jgi:hypothetical protein
MIDADARVVAAGRAHLAAHVLCEQVVLLGGGEKLIVERHGRGNLGVGDATDGETDVVEHVVTGRDRLVDDVESHLAVHAPEIDGGDVVVDAHDATGNA